MQPQRTSNLAPFETAFVVSCDEADSELISFSSILEDARAQAAQQSFKLLAFLDAQIIVITNVPGDPFTLEQHLNILAEGVIVEEHQDKKVLSLVFPGVYEKGKPSGTLSGIRLTKGAINVIVRATAMVDMSSAIVTGGMILGG
jgi:hypothetical protein